MTDDAAPAPTKLSAYEMGQLLGDSLPAADSIGPGELALVEAARSLLDAVVRTDIDDAARARIATQIEALADELRRMTRLDVMRLARHADGRIENLVQAGAGRCNPRSLRIRFDDPPAGSDPATSEVHGVVVLDASATGPPGRAHGGIVATILDEALGIALTRAGRTGMTVALEMTLHAGVPIDTPIDIRARCTAFDGRKTHVAAELLVDGAAAAKATGLFVTSRRT
jgi:acyl-coenzyme A thioesterase PaaI-like protein